MKNTWLKNKNVINLTLTAIFVVLVGMACNFGAEEAKLPEDAELKSLVKQTTADFAKAIESGDFKAFSANTSKEFQNQFNEDKLKSTFNVFIERKDDVVPILNEAAGAEPTFAGPATIREEKGHNILVTSGSFPTDPVETKFNYEYVRQDGKWKLLKIEVRL